MTDQVRPLTSVPSAPSPSLAAPSRANRVEAFVSRVTLRLLMVSGIAGIVAFFPLIAYGPPSERLVRAIVPVSLVLGALLGYEFVRRGWIRLGAAIPLAIFYVVVTNYLVVTGYGLHGYALSAFVLMIVIVSLVLGHWAGAVAAAVAIATVATFYVLERRGLVVDQGAIQSIPALNILLVYCILYASAAAVVWVFARYFHLSMGTLEAEEQRLRAIFEVAPLGYVVHRGGRVVLANQRAARTVGFATADDARGAELLGYIAPVEREVARSAISRLTEAGARRKASATGPDESAHSITYRIRHRSGEWIECDAYSASILLADGPALLTVLRDVTRERSIQREREAVLRGSPAGIFIVGTGRVIEYANPAMERMLGYAADALVGVPTRSICADESEWSWIGTTGYERIRGEGMMRAEIRYRRLDGGVLWGLLQGVEIGAGSGAPDGMPRLLFSVVDISEQKRMQSEFAMAKAAAEEASQAKTRFLAHMSHEIRTPMNGVIGMAELLVDDPDGEHVRRRAQTIRRSGKALLGVLDDVLDLAKIEAGEMRIESAPFDLPTLLREMADLYAEPLRQKGIGFELRLAPGLPEQVIGDIVRLRQVLLNLLGNAVKFTEQGAVSLGARHEAAGIRFEVADTGIGIPTDRQSRLFEAFAQADDSTTRRHGGTGLGLAIARQLVHLMGGRIGVESSPGRGSRFWFEVLLPEAAGAGPTALDDATPGDVFTGRRVLIVEDDPINAEVTRALLERRGLIVGSAENGDAGWREAARGPYDLVLMDCQMPLMDGFESTRRIREEEAAGRRPRVPIVAVTAHAISGVRDACMRAGMDDYLLKPFDGRNLDRILGRWLIGAAATPTAPDSGTVDEQAFRELLTIDAETPGFLRRMIGFFADTAESEIRRIGAASSDPESAIRGAHTLKSTAARFGARRLAGLAAGIESRLRSQEALAQAETMSELRREFESALASLRSRIDADRTSVDPRDARPPARARQ